MLSFSSVPPISSDQQVVAKHHETIACIGKIYELGGGVPQIKLQSEMKIAIEIGNELGCRILLRCKADPNALLNNSITPLALAIVGKQASITGLLLDHKADLNITDLHFSVKIKPGLSCLKQAISSGSTATVQQLIQGKADINAHHGKMTPLSWAIAEKTLAVTGLLLDLGASVTEYPPEREYTRPLHTVYKVGLQFIPEWSPIIARMADKDGDLSNNVLKKQLLGHRLSLLGPLFEQLSETVTYPALAKTIQSMGHKISLENSLQQKLIESLLQAANPFLPAETYTSRWRSGDFVTLAAGCLYHGVSCGLKGKVFFLGNTGFGSDKFSKGSGITFYTIGNEEKMPEVIETILDIYRNRRSKLQEDVPLSEAALGEKQLSFLYLYVQLFLNLKEVYFLPKQEQESGNCGWKAAELSLSALLTLMHQSEERSWEESCLLATPICSDILREDMALAIQECAEMKDPDPLFLQAAMKKIKETVALRKLMASALEEGQGGVAAAASSAPANLAELTEP